VNFRTAEKQPQAILELLYFKETEEPMKTTILPKHDQTQEQRSILKVFAGTVQHFFG
jgi:hypothetical protein